MPEFLGHLDTCSIYKSILYVEGWANKLSPRVYYKGKKVECNFRQMPRPDLVPHFGSQAASWGFVICALLPMRKIDHAELTLFFTDDIKVANPCAQYSASGDSDFGAMEARFRQDVAAKKGSLLEIGSRARSGTDYRSWFPPDIDYLGLDVADGPNVDVVGDAHHLSRHVAKTFDFVFSVAVFEHLLMPWKVALEMNKVMKTDATGLIISHGAWPLHEEPWDFFRFSKESWQGLFNKHTGFEILEAQYRSRASIVPDYASSKHFEKMSLGSTYLMSGCRIRKIGEPLIAWEADVGEVYNLAYSH